MEMASVGNSIIMSLMLKLHRYLHYDCSYTHAYLCTYPYHVRKKHKRKLSFAKHSTQTGMRHSRHAQLEKPRSLKAVATYLPLAQYGNREKGTKLA